MHPNNVGFHEVGFLIGRVGDGEFFFVWFSAQWRK